MDGLPSNIMFHIFSRVPGKCLARSRCVSKEWCKYIDDRYLMIVNDERVLEPIPILYHFHRSYDDRKIHSLCFHVIESKRKEPRRYYKKARVGSKPRTYVSELKEDSFLEFLPKKPLSESSYVDIKVRGSCNGLMCLSLYEDYVLTSLVVVDPLRKECYELPPLPMRFDSYMQRESYGIGFDASTNTLKMVCVLDKGFAQACTLVHVFGTNSWREIPKVPSYPITGKAIFADGCLHWLVTYLGIKTEHAGRHVIWFDVEKEEFVLIDPPKRMCDLWRNYRCGADRLVDLNGEVGFVCVTTMEVWVLKKKEWVTHYRFEKKRVLNGDNEVLGCWNKDGDILIRNIRGENCKFFVYNLKSGVRHKTNIVVPDDGCDPNIFMHPNKLSSIHGIGANSFPMKKADFKISCQHLLSFN